MAESSGEVEEVGVGAAVVAEGEVDASMVGVGVAAGDESAADVGLSTCGSEP